MMEQNLATYAFAENNKDQNLASEHHAAKALIPEDDFFIEDGDDSDKEFMDSLLRFSDDEGDEIFSHFAGEVTFLEESDLASTFREYDNSLLHFPREERNAIFTDFAGNMARVEESNSMPCITYEDPPYTPFATIGPEVTHDGIDQALEQRRSKHDPSNIELADHVISQLKRLTEAMRRSEISRAKLIPIKRAMMAQQWQEFRGLTLESLMKPSRKIYWNA